MKSIRQLLHMVREDRKLMRRRKSTIGELLELAGEFKKGVMLS